MSFYNRVVVYPQLRPPVAAVDGNSPLRGKKYSKVFKVHEKMHQKDPLNSPLNNKVIYENYLDDGKLIPTDNQWDNYFSFTKSKFNTQAFTHYKEFFDKKHRMP